MSDLNLEQEISIITEQHNVAKKLLDDCKKALIEKVKSLMEKGECPVSFLQTSLQLTANNQINNGSLESIASEEYWEYKHAVQSAQHCHKEEQAISSFKDTRTKLLGLVQTEGLNEKTKTAVCDVVAYIDKLVEPSLWHRIVGKTPWHMLQNSLQQTYVFIEKKQAINHISHEAFNVYIDYLNTVNGKPNTEPGHYTEGLLPTLPLSPLIHLVPLGLEKGFLSGGILCPALGIVVCLAISLAMLYFVISMRINTGLSRKLLNVADAEREFLVNDNQKYLQKKQILESGNLNMESLMPLMQSIHSLYGTKDPEQALELLKIVEKMLQAKSRFELKTATKNLKEAAHFNSTLCCCIWSCLFTSEEKHLANMIQNLLSDLDTTLTQNESNQIGILMAQFENR